MMNERRNTASLEDDRLAGAQPDRWIVPLQSMTVFSTAEFTQGGALPPGDDGNGTWTDS